jgi:hypothetical protein
MPRFNVYTGDLQSVAATIAAAQNPATEIPGSLNGLLNIAPAAGHPVATAALQSFLGTWSTAIGHMTGDAQTLSSHLNASAQAYEETENALKDTQ